MARVNSPMPMEMFTRESFKTIIKTIKIARFNSDLGLGILEVLWMENIMGEAN